MQLVSDCSSALPSSKQICGVEVTPPWSGCGCPQVLNETFSQDLKQYLSPHFSLDDASFISIDATGADVRVRLGSEFNVERLGFADKVHSLDEAIAAVKGVLQEC